MNALKKIPDGIFFLTSAYLTLLYALNPLQGHMYDTP